MRKLNRRDLLEDELSERLRNLSEGGADKRIGRLQLTMPMSNLLIAPNGQTSNLLISEGQGVGATSCREGPQERGRELLNSRKDKDGGSSKQFLRELRDWIV